ncbi:MAG: extracellular solute-binding protein [Clostridiales bacterium]|nr:extracellular solute-binding protein [Clostridiales bacterium]
MKRFKGMFISVLVLVLIMGLIGCAPDEKEPEVKPSDGQETKAPEAPEVAEDVDISIRITWDADSGRGKALRKIVDEFENQNPNISVTLYGGTASGAELLTQILGGDTPEVLQVAYRDVKALGSQGAFMDLSAEFAANKGYFYEELWNLADLDGQLFGYPWLGHSIQLIYNRTLFAEAGLSGPPDNWEQLYEYAKKLTKDTDGDGKLDQFGLSLVGQQHHDITWLFNMFLHQAGGEIVKMENGEEVVALNSPEGLKALEFYYKLLTEVTPPDTVNKNGGDAMADFRSQITAMQFQGPWGITDIWKNGNPFEVGAAPAPAGPAGRASDIGPFMLSIPEGVEGAKLEAAIALIDFLGSKKGQEMIMMGEKGDDGNYYPFRVPIRKDLADTDFFKDNPDFLVFIEGMKYPSISTPSPNWAKVETEIYRSQLNQVMIGAITPQEALDNIERLGNDIME